MNNTLKTVALPAVAALGLTLAAPGAVADAARGTASAAPLHLAQAAGSEFPADTLDAYAGAAARVTELRQEWMPRLSDAQSQEEAAELRARATREMTAAVEDAGLSVEKYNAITAAAQEDPRLLERIRERMQ